MENQEQKLRSVNMQGEVEISPMAQLYRVEIRIKNKELKSYFDSFWKENEQKIIDKLNIKGRKGKGGGQKNARRIAESQVRPEILYMSTALDVLRDYLVDILFIEQVEIADYSEEEPDEDARVLGLVYFTPELHHDGEIDLTVEKDKLLTFEEDKEWENRKKELRLKYKIYREYGVSGLIGEEQKDELQVLLDVMSKCDGGPSDELSYQDKWQNLKYLPEGLKEAILNHEVDDVFECCYRMKVGKDVKEVVSTVKIHKVREIILPDVDDELAEKEGASSLNELKSRFLKSYKEHIESQNNTIISDTIVHKLLISSTFEPFPMSWVSENVRASIDANKERFGCDEKGLCRIFGVDTKDKLEEQFKGELYRKNLTLVAIQYYAKSFDLDPEDLDGIVNHMVENSKIVEKENG